MIRDNLNKYFVIDAKPDEIFNKLKSDGQVFFHLDGQQKEAIMPYIEQNKLRILRRGRGLVAPIL